MQHYAGETLSTNNCATHPRPTLNGKPKILKSVAPYLGIQNSPKQQTFVYAVHSSTFAPYPKVSHSAFGDRAPTEPGFGLISNAAVDMLRGRPSNR
ncbi:hypothetical protein AG1IA_00402 [Rhizoctonia solani AG-1 IA]|uniref:Uncharacterized protein n=1 Tax=Thanatephorus cucumeris (strain AG1-IA) TaxID=983506 RepID=L8XA17_THACA|nr:hypothetical protein AG1IA_00402 [Rhizoctonia solani AG-1 IA]